MIDQNEALCKLADACGIEINYLNSEGKLVYATNDAILAILNQLDIPIKHPEEALQFHQAKLLAEAFKPLLPVNVAWFEREQGYAEIPLLLPKGVKYGKCRAKLILELGGQINWEFDISDLVVSASKVVANQEFITYQIEIPKKIDLGQHLLSLQINTLNLESTLLAAPLKAFGSELDPKQKNWGVFLPLYAAKSERNLGAGDFTDLEQLIEWTAKQGGKVVGTLPLLAAFLDEPCEPSPYSPASRLFWNEFYLDIQRIPEFSYSPQAQLLFNSAEFQAQAQALRDLDLVDYSNVMRLKRSVLEWCVNAFLQCATPERKAAFDAYLAHRPEASDYALFRATVEKFKASWHSWPIELHQGKLNDALVNPLATHYFLLSQWWAEEQINSVATKSLDLGAKGLYLDLPLGVNADSYDVYRHREIFALGASGGAPPDSFFTLGQDWGFPPIRPDKLLDDKLVYLRSCLKHHMKHCSMLRVDHVMGIHRLYWVPKGLGAKNGAYVRYNSDAMYAIYNLESYRNKTLIAGEDLGTVPPAVRPAMKKHGWHRLFVGQFEMNPVEGCVLNKAPEGAIASLNTHDLPPFAAFWTGTDIDDRVEMGLLTKEEAKAEKSVREALFVRVLEAVTLQTGVSFESKLEQEEIAEVLASLYGEMMQSQAGTVLANLEDFWFTKNPQNVPGTWKEKPNWRHKASYSVVELLSVGCIEKILGKIIR